MSSSASSAPDDDDASSSSPGPRNHNTLAVTHTQAASDSLEGSSDDDDDSLPGLDESLPGLGDTPAGGRLGISELATSSMASSETNTHRGLRASVRLSSSDPDPNDHHRGSASSSSSVASSPRDSLHDTQKGATLELSTKSDDYLGERCLGTIGEECVVHLPVYDSNPPLNMVKQRVEAIDRRACAELVQQETIRRQQDEEAHRLREKENQFWDTLPSEDVGKLRGMLQVVSLYQQQLQANENVIDDLHTRIETNDRAHRGLRRRFQQSQHGVIVVEEQEASLKQECEHWGRKCERYANDNDIGTLQMQHHNLQQELQRLLLEAAPARDTLLDLRKRLIASLSKQDEQRLVFSEYEECCKQTLEAVKANHGVHFNDLQKAEFSRMRSALADAQVHVRDLAHENQDVFEDLRAQQQEGARLQQQCAESREKVLDLAAQVRAYLDEPRVAAQLGVSLDGSMASMSFLPFLGDDPYHDVELESVRKQCKALERECQRTNDALERKQMECERWRARYLEPRPGGLRGNFEALHEDHALGEAHAPFVLGPEPGTAEEKLIMTPRF